jgi:HD-GYP domain-containing protein (c-di-GMP phosphodiesterase class II)
MTTDRSYRRALSFEEAAAELQRCADTQFDPQVVDALVAALARYRTSSPKT